MTKSALQIARAAYQPKLPKGLTGTVKAVAGAATLSVADQEEIKKLFRKVFAAIWPEPATYTSPHDDTIIIAVCHDIKSF